MFDRLCGMFQIKSCFSSSHYISIPIILLHDNLMSPKNFFLFWFF